MKSRLLALLLLLASAACGATRRGGLWSDRATVLPSSERLLAAARNAATDPWTWAPLVGAGAIAAGGWDREISDWARRETPVFGSTKSATSAGGTLGALTRNAWIGSALATPSGDDPTAWIGDKLRGLSIEWAATLSTTAVTSLGKSATQRERPNDANDRSFPSSATSDAFAHNALIRRNLDAIGAPLPVDVAARAGIGAIAAGVAWSRVEAGAHHPVDVLAGAALGNFVAIFIHDAFLDLPSQVDLSAWVEPIAGEYALGLSFRF